MIEFNLRRLGHTEDAVGRMINGDLPEEPKTRVRMLQGTREAIRTLVKQHEAAQAVLSDSASTGKPFALFLRSFAAEHETRRGPQTVFAKLSIRSQHIQKLIAQSLRQHQVDLVKFHGGSDAFFGVTGSENNLTSPTEGWVQVAQELIEGAGLIFVLMSHATPGLLEEIERIRAAGRPPRSILIWLDDNESSALGGGRHRFTEDYADFPNAFRLDGDEDGSALEPLFQAISSILGSAPPTPLLPLSTAVRFSYLEPKFTKSDDFAQARAMLLDGMETMRITIDRRYWDLLERNGIYPAGHWGPLRLAYQLFGTAIAVEAHSTVLVALDHIAELEARIGTAIVAEIDAARKKYELLWERVGAPVEELEEGIDILAPEHGAVTAEALCRFARSAAEEGRLSLALRGYQAAVIHAQDETDIAMAACATGNAAEEWARLQTRVNQQTWAEMNFQLAEKLFREAADRNPLEYSDQLPCFLMRLADFRMREGEPDRAVARAEESIELWGSQKQVSQESAGRFAESLNSFGHACRIQNRQPQALQPLQVAIALNAQRAASNPEALIHLIRTQLTYAACLGEMTGGADEALAVLILVRRNLDRADRLGLSGAAKWREVTDRAGEQIDEIRREGQSEPT